MTTPTPRMGLGRLRRLAQKELREILRDRRTIITLILMPLLLYPLLSVAFQQLLMTGVVGGDGPVAEIQLGFVSEAEGEFIQSYLEMGQRVLEQRYKETQSPTPRWPHLVLREAKDMELAVREHRVALGIRLKRPEQMRQSSGPTIAVDIEVLHLEGSSSALDALRVVQGRLAAANQRLIANWLRQEFDVPQRDEPMRALIRTLPDPEAKEGFKLAAIVPLILILMTITGGVYPAIDLTAGERERGTLEVLVAAPLPRFSLLVAKYVAVMAVALLTAVVNLTMMTLTVTVMGLSSVLIKEGGLTAGLLVQVFALLLLFAAFFSAVLLALTSFARSFKEAQAYLIPLMLLSLAPGMLGLMPGIKLDGALAVAPLINIVLLARDLFEGNASALMAVVVVCSTLLYAGAALALAARVFGAEGVLYSSHSGWSELLRRPQPGGRAPTFGAALGCLALLFPAYFFLHMAAAQLELELATRLVFNAILTVLLFAGFPLVAAWWQRLHLPSAFRLAAPHWATLAGAVLLGLGLWAFVYELVLLLKEIGVSTPRSEHLTKALKMLEQLKTLSPGLLIVTFALVPAVAEELCFRGFLYRGLEGQVRPAATIVATGLLFGAFHLMLVNALAVERLISSASLGLVLGWVTWRAGSIWPTIALHAIHNGLIAMLARFQPEFSFGDFASTREHLPASWLIATGASVVAGAVLVHLGGRLRFRARNANA